MYETPGKDKCPSESRRTLVHENAGEKKQVELDHENNGKQVGTDKLKNV